MRNAVTPLVGVWIEIPEIAIAREIASVTPLVGVWIEILHRIHRRGHC